MSKVQSLRDFVHQRLTSAAEDIFELLERTILEYEEKLLSQQKLLDAVFQPQVRIKRADEEQLVIKGVWSVSLEQDQPPELPQVKDEHEEQWINQEGEQHGGLEEAPRIQVTVTPAPVKSEEDEREEAQSVQHHHSQRDDSSDTERLETEAAGENTGGSEAAQSLSVEKHLQAETHVNKSDSSQAQSDSRSDAEESGEPGLKPPQNLEGSVSDVGRGSGKTPRGSPQDATDSGHKGHVQQLKALLMKGREKRFSCSVCKKAFSAPSHLKRHMVTHTKERPFSCSVCKKAFSTASHLKHHMVTHSKERPFRCSVCKKAFSAPSYLKRHMVTHSKERQSSCSVCKKAFSAPYHLKRHMVTHSKERPFSCSVCKKAFSTPYHLKRHMVTHSKERPFRCSVCKKAFKSRLCLKRHMGYHSEEKPFSCSVCKKPFTRRDVLKKHMVSHKK